MNRKLDKAIAEELFYRVGNTMNTPDKIWENECPVCGYSGHWNPTSIPYFSSQAHAMLILDEEMREREYELSLEFLDKEWKAVYWHSRDRLGSGVAETEFLARALAAYKALTGKDWEGEGE